MRKRHLLTYIAAIFTTFLLTVSCSQTPAPVSPIVPSPPSVALTISAAASLKDALGDIKQSYKPATLTFNFGASGSLQQQIEQGAPVDIFISAAPKQMDALQQKGLLLTETRKNLLKNDVVLIASKSATAIADFKDLTSDTVKKIALGEPKSVPAGKYAEEVLTSLNLLESLKPKMIFAKDVRQVLAYVETGNADAGIVYITDAKTSNQVKVITTAPSGSHSPIVYPIAVLKASKSSTSAKDFVQFLSGSEAKMVFEKYGFGVAG